MGYFCWLCDCVTAATTINLLLEHLHYRHAITAHQKCRVRCGQQGCCMTFDNIQAFRMHLKRQHLDDPYPCPSRSEHRTPDDSNTMEEEVEISSVSSSVEQTGGAEIVMNEIDLLRNTLNDFVISLKSKNVTQNVVTDALSGVTSIAKLICSIVKSSLDKNEQNIDSVRQKISDVENALQDSAIVSSAYKLKKYLMDHHKLVSPEEIFLQNRIEMERSLPCRIEKPSVKFVPETMQYISIIKTIQKILCDTKNFAGLQDVVMRGSGATMPDDEMILAKFSDCIGFQKHPLVEKDRNFVQIHLFYDEFETANPLGSKANIHKLGGLYMSIRNFPNYINSQLKNIFPVIYCYASDAKKLGFNAILHPLLNDLKALENGLPMKVNGENVCVYGSVVMWSGDNLGIHQIFGFSSNFQAERCCQYCHANRQDREMYFRESELSLRTKSDYVADASKSAQGMKEAGLTFRSCLAELTTFSIPDGVCPDSMHDILEGCLQYELKLVLHQLIIVDDEVCLTLDNFNNRMKLFCYGVDDKNKPQPLNLEKLVGKQKKLGMNASQAWCFARYFCLFVGDIVSEDNEYMKLVHLLLDIMDVVFAPRVTISMTYLLEEMIVKHHKLFKTLFPNHSLIPKQHFLIHYPSKIRQLGPSIQYWSMRFEAKHASAKDFGRSVHNFKNICKSIAWQQQIRQCTDWLVPVEAVRVDVGPGESVLPCALDVPYQVFVESQIPLFEELYVANYVTVNGSTYKPGHVVVSGMSDNHVPVFVQILFVLFRNNTCCFVVQNLTTCQYSCHLHAYEVDYTDSYSFKDYTQLADVHPLSLVSGFGKYSSCNFVVLRHEIV